MRVSLLLATAFALPATTAAAEPVASADVPEVDPASFAVASPYRISSAARAGKIRYRLSFSPPIAWVWPETGEQRVRTESGDTVLTICEDCGREPAPSEDELQRYRRANAWVNSDDRGVRAFALTTGGGSVDRRMRKLVAAVRSRMTGAIEYDDYQTASQALRSHAGDCTEAAVLLAAAARARGIPARVVAGLAYASRFVGKPHAFGPHMWVQAWDGRRWTSYDAGLGAFDAGHIALAVGDGAPDGFSRTMAAISRLRIDRAESVIDDDMPSP